jgi:hypothetical protein
MRRALALAAVTAGLAALHQAPATAAGCDVRVARTCVVMSLCNTVADPVHAADAALGSPLGGHPYCPVN